MLKVSLRSEVLLFSYSRRVFLDRAFARKEKIMRFTMENWKIKWCWGSRCSVSHPVGSVGDQGQSSRKIYNIELDTSMIQPFENNKTKTVCVR